MIVLTTALSKNEGTFTTATISYWENKIKVKVLTQQQQQQRALTIFCLTEFDLLRCTFARGVNPSHVK